ncbi:MAG: cadherin domain-containing protein [Chloroflexi bacterium]|nr:cadherin domain-containing protein [Chloroflexota bacterium]
MLIIRDGQQRALALLAPVTGLLVLLAVLLTGTTGVRADATCSVPPVNLTSALSDDGTAVVLTWQASPDCTPDVYEVHRRDMDVDGSRMTKIDSVDGGVLTYTDTTVSAGQVYRYKIRSNDLGSRSGRTEITIPEATVAEPTPEPSQPSITSRVEPRADVSLVTNFGAGGVSVNQNTPGYAQRFTTGSSPAGYTLSAVEVKFDSGNEFTLSVCTVESDNTPTTTCWGFTAPSSFDENSTVSFTAPSTMADLDPATSYSVVIEPKVTSQTFGMAVTSQNTEDSGGAAGWTIADGSHILSGGSWTSQSNVMRINVKGAVLNSEPTFDDSPPVTRDADEDVAGGTAIGMPVAATDDDGDTLHYELSPASATFSVDSATGQIRTASGVTLDHETSDSHTVTIRVRDGFDDDRGADTDFDASVTVTINVIDVDEPATVSLAPSSGPYELGVQITATATDEDEDFMVDSYQWASGATQTGTFTDISGATNMTYTPTEDDLNNFLRVTVQYDDTHGDDKQITATTDSKVVLGNVEPEFSLASTTRSVAENTATGMNVGAPVSTTDSDGDTLEYRLTGTDSGSFTIEAASGQIKTSAALNFESKSSYEVVVEVRDKKDSTGAADLAWDDTIDVTINVDNVDEPGTVTISGTESGGETLTASVTDPDGTVSNLTWKWELGAMAAGPFAPISGATAATYMTVAVDVNRFLRATASYTDPQGSGKSADAVTGQISASNAEPEFPASEMGSRSVPENSPVGTAVGDPVEAEDDDGDTLHYSLSSDGAASFTIDSATGQIRTKMGVTYNFEGTAYYAFSVIVRDSKDAAGNPNMAPDDTINVTVSLTNVNEAPEIQTTQTMASVAENTPATTAIITFAADDVDASTTFSWSVEAADDGDKFDINSDGELTFKTSPNFEMPTDDGTDNVYDVTVKVTDNGTPAMSDTHQLAVAVTNINEAPEITSTGGSHTDPSFDEIEYDADAQGLTVSLVVATYTATDVDADDTGANWSWSLSGNDAGDFTIAKNASGEGVLSFKERPNFEDPADADTMNDYDLTVIVKDDENLQDSLPVEVTVEAVNERPRIIGDTFVLVDEIEFDLTDAEVALEGLLQVLDYNATDQENDTVTWSIRADPPDNASVGHMEIDAATGLLSFKSGSRPNFEAPVDGNSDNDYAIRIRATDDDPDHPRYREVGVLVRIQNKNEKPEIPGGVADESFAEIEWDAATADLDVMTYIPRDEETSTLTDLSWSLAGTDAADFQITEDSTTGHGTLSFRDRPNYEDPTDRVNTTDSHAADDNMYQVIVKISDGPNTRDYPLTVTVTNINETPQFTDLVGPGLHADEIEHDSGTTAADMASIPATLENKPYWYPFEARDEEGDDIIWTITGLDAVDFVIVEDPNVMEADSDERAIIRWNIVPDRENPLGSHSSGSDFYVLTVNASDGANIARYDLFIRIDDVNERPEFTGTIETAIALDEHDATLDANLQEPPYAFPTIATYTGRDEEGGVTWSLTGADAGDFEIDSGGNVVFKETPSFEDPKDSGGDNVYNFTVVVRDIQSKTNRRTAEQPVTVTVRDIEEAGAISVSNLNPAVGEDVTFTISDPDGGIVLDQVPGSGGFAWVIQTRTSGGAWQQLIHSNTGLASYTYVADEDETDLELRAIVNPYTDRRGGGKSAESEVTAAITPDPIVNAPPRIRQGGTQNVPEADAGEQIGDPVTASDRDNDNLTFAIGEGADGALFEIHPTSGQLRTLQALDFETTTGLLLVPVNVSDGRDADGNVETERVPDASTTVGVRVLDVEEEGVVTLSDAEPGVGTTVQATLSDGDGSISGRSWRWWRSRDGRTGWTPIPGTTSSSTSSSYTTVLADAGFYLRAAVGYTDNRGGGKRAEGITALRVFGENQQPTFGATADGARSVPENSSPGTSIGAPVVAHDPENDRLTYLLSGTDAAAFSIVAGSGQLRVKEPLDFETKSSYEVTVDVHDGKDGLGNPSAAIDDSIDVTITVGNVEEPGSVTLTTLTATIQARVEVTAVLEDDDGPTSVTWAWARSPNGRTDWVNLVGVTGSRYTPTLVDAGKYIRATASYSDGHGSNKSAAKVSPRVGDPPPVNSAPAFPVTEDGRRDVPEDASGGDRIGDPVAANDVNFDSLTYSLSGADAASFEIGANSGQLRLASGVSLDFEGKRTYRVTVSVSDRADQNDDPDDVIDDTISVVVSVTDVNEAPVVGGDTTPSLSENSSAAIATYTAADPERDTIEWSVNNNDFWISSRGQLYFATPPDYEDGATSFSIRVTAEDPGGLTGSLDVTVTVTDVEEAGVLTLSPPRGWQGTRFDAALSDGDGGTSGFTWKWERSSNRSSWQEIAGATSSSYTAGADDVGSYLRASVEYSDRRGSNKRASAVLGGRIGDARPGSNAAPAFDEAEVPRSVRQGTGGGRPVGAPVQATDPDSDDVLTYSLSGPDADLFDIDPDTGQIRTKGVLDPDVQETHNVTVDVRDGFSPSYNPSDATDDSVDVIITVARVSTRSSGGGGGGGGGGFGPGPGEVSLTVTAAVAGEGAPAGHRFGFALRCTPSEAGPEISQAFSLGAGQGFGRFVPGAAPCSLTVTDDGGADRVDGLFTDFLLGENRRIVVTFIYGLVTTPVDPASETVVEDGAVSLTIPAGSRGAPYAVLLETGAEHCEGGLEFAGEVIACYSVTVFDADGGEETDATLLVPATVTITLDAATVEELGGLAGVRAARERGELRMLRRDDAGSPWREIPFTVGESDAGAVQVVLSISAFSDFALISSEARLRTVPLHTGWNVVLWDGADGAAIADALGDLAEQVDVIYQWVAETQTWRSHRPGAPSILSAFHTLTRGATYWVRAAAATEWTVVGGPIEPPAAEALRLHPRWTEVVWRGADGAPIAGAFGALLDRVEVIYQWLAASQTWRSHRPGAPPILSAFHTFETGANYWIAVAEAIDWTVPLAPP